jgi:hypothetical protein
MVSIRFHWLRFLSEEKSILLQSILERNCGGGTPARKLQLDGEIRLRQSELITQSAHKSPDENETPLFHWLNFFIFAVASCPENWTK